MGLIFRVQEFVVRDQSNAQLLVRHQKHREDRHLLLGETCPALLGEQLGYLLEHGADGVSISLGARMLDLHYLRLIR